MLPMRGNNVAADVFVGSQRVAESNRLKSLEISAKTTEYEDEYLGNDFDELDQQTRGYNFKLENNTSDLSLWKAWKAQDDARKARLPIPTITLVVTWNMRNGVSETWILTDCILKPSKKIGGAKDTVMTSFDGLAKDYTRST